MLLLVGPSLANIGSEQGLHMERLLYRALLVVVVVAIVGYRLLVACMLGVGSGFWLRQRCLALICVLAHMPRHCPITTVHSQDAKANPRNLTVQGCGILQQA